MWEIERVNLLSQDHRRLDFPSRSILIEKEMNDKHILSLENLHWLRFLRIVDQEAQLGSGYLLFLVILQESLSLLEQMKQLWLVEWQLSQREGQLHPQWLASLELSQHWMAEMKMTETPLACLQGQKTVGLH